MTLYLTLAVVSSAMMAFGLLMMKSRAEALPPARGRRIFAAVWAWIRDPVWTGGLGVQTGGYAFYLAALSGAPVSMVAVMMQGGIGAFVLLSVLFLGEHARPREWLGIGATVAAVALLSLSLPAGAEQELVSMKTLGLLSAALIVAGALPMVRRQLADSGTAQALASGIAFGLGSLYAKALTQSLAGIPVLSVAHAVALAPWVCAVVATNISGLVLLQNSFHQARGIIAMPLSSALSNVVPIAGGMLAFGEALPANRTAAVMRLLAFLLTVAASTTLVTMQMQSTEDRLKKDAA